MASKIDGPIGKSIIKPSILDGPKFNGSGSRGGLTGGSVAPAVLGGLIVGTAETVGRLVSGKRRCPACREEWARVRINGLKLCKKCARIVAASSVGGGSNDAEKYKVRIYRPDGILHKSFSKVGASALESIYSKFEGLVIKVDSLI